MPATSVAGSVFTVEIDLNDYEAQVTSGTITSTPTITRTKTLADVNFKKTDLAATANLSFLYDGNAGMYDALNTAASAGDSCAVIVTGGTGTWTGTCYVESLEMSVDAAGIATATVNLTGTITFT